MGVIVITDAIIYYDVAIGDYAHISPNASLGGASCVGPLARMGIGSELLPSVRVGLVVLLAPGLWHLRIWRPILWLLDFPRRFWGKRKSQRFSLNSVPRSMEL